MSYRNNEPRGGGGGGGRRGSLNRRPSNLNSLPVEQGIICTLKESFGFIHCADRPEEIFFHYSEVSNCHPDELQIDTEVDFRVGGDPEKLAAFDVHALPSGTVQWETEEAEGKIFKGVIEKAIRYDRDSFRSNSGLSGNGSNRGGYDAEGSVRVLLDDTDEPSSTTPEADESANGEDVEKQNTNGGSNNNNNKKSSNDKSGPLVRIRDGEYTGAVSPNSTGSENGSPGNRLYRGDMIEFRILTDRRTKQKYARHVMLVQTYKERKRMESATAEEGIITALKSGYGFIKSNKRRENVYFHYSNLILPDPDTEKTNEKTSSDQVENGGSQSQEDVEFELKIGQEVKFLVVSENGDKSPTSKSSARQIQMLPKGSVVFHTVEATGVKGIVVMCPHPPTPGVKNDDSKEGKIQLLDPIPVSPSGNDESTPPESITEILLHYSDAPGGVFTYQNHRNQNVNALWVQEGDTLLFDVIRETVDGTYRAIPTMHTLGVKGVVIEPEKDNKKNAKPMMRLVCPSLVSRSEGTVHTLKQDYGFFHFAERPIDVHFKMYDLLPDEMQNDIRKQMGINGPVKLELGAGVQFDICAHGNITSGGRNRHGRGGHPHERENIRGQRVVVLPKSTVHLEKLLVSDARGVIKSADSKQLYAGFLDIEQDIQQMSLDDRHPLVADMLDSFLEESSRPNGRKTLVFRDTLGQKDDHVVIEMAKQRAGNHLECTHIPIPGIGGIGKLCLRRLDGDGDEQEKSTETANADKKQEEEVVSKKNESNFSKNIRYDKSCLHNDAKDDIPPGPGDIVTCDVFQSRRTMKIILRNIKIVERKEVDPTAAVAQPTSNEGSGKGVIKDVLPKRNFGFISVLDDNASRREILFFHLPPGGGYRKGTEVKFDIVMEGSKRVATNVELLPKGTIPSTVSKNACLGYVLMEPSHTSLADTPLRKAQSNVSASSQNSAGSRWADKKDDGKKSEVDLHEEGCILLLEDKTGMFQKKGRSRRRKKKGKGGDVSDDASTGSTGSSDDGLSSDGELSGDESASSDDDATPAGPVNVLSHLGYKNGSVAIHGSGVTSSMDGSGNPKRGDLVTFVKGRKRNTVRDVRVQGRQKATLLRGRLEDIQRIDTESGKNKGKAKFIAATDKEEVYEIDLAEVISCNANKLKERESVEGIIHDGKIFGVCRTCDLYLSSKIGTGHKTRPKLNLTVKKDRGGTIMAQSMMAKGPDGTNGFTPGWTKRISKYSGED